MCGLRNPHFAGQAGSTASTVVYMDKERKKKKYYKYFHKVSICHLLFEEWKNSFAVRATSCVFFLSSHGELNQIQQKFFKIAPF